MAELDWHPQAKEMADESMVRNLIAQAEAIWPQEQPIFDTYVLSENPDVLDVGCGIGEIAWRLASRYPTARITGIDLVASHLELAREKTASVADRVTFLEGDARALPLPDRAFDLVVCRHLLQAIPRPDLALAEMMRVAKPGGYLHLLVEDYGMLHFGGAPALDEFWHRSPHAYSAATEVDLFIGRNCYQQLRRLGITEIHTHYIAVDTERVPRDTFARIFEAWRDGYIDAIAMHAGLTPAEVRQRFDESIACVRDPDRFALWLIPVVSARVPGSQRPDSANG